MATGMRGGRDFKTGDDVEVTSPIPKMRGTLFPAKIIGKSRDKSKYKVEYKRVRARMERKVNGNHRHALREKVDAALIKPSPPPQESSNCRYKLGDVVDGFFCGGWWEGVISDVLKDSTYGVFFRFAQENFKFEPEELRLHREWVKGSWLPPPQVQDDQLDVSNTKSPKSPKSQVKEDFVEGAPVEVCNDEDGFQGAWFSAKIVEVLGKDKFLIRYKRLKTDDGKDFLTEEVDAQHLRPCPPPALMVQSFSLNAKVDAFYNDGWWEGLVRKVLHGSRYKVYFKGTDDELQFEHSDLRPRQVWIDRTWVMASQALRH